MLCLFGLAARAEDTGALMAKGDQFDKRLQAKEALEIYLPANKLEPNNVDLLVRIARQYRHLMSDASSKQEKLRLGNISLEFASRAATLAPNNAEAQLSPAISLGKMLPFMGSKDQIKASPRIKVYQLIGRIAENGEDEELLRETADLLIELFEQAAASGELDKED